jgi:hypothetical protein
LQISPHERRKTLEEASTFAAAKNPKSNSIPIVEKGREKKREIDGGGRR